MTRSAMISLLLVVMLSGGLGESKQAAVHYSHSKSDAWQLVGDQRKEDRVMGEFKLVVDRFEGSWAVVEYDGETFDIPRSLLPVEAKEGDTLTLTLQVNPADTAERKKRIENLIDELFF